MKLPAHLQPSAHRLGIVFCAALAAMGLRNGVVSAAPFLSVDLGNSQSVVQAGFQSFNQNNQAGVTYSTSEGSIFFNVAGEQSAGFDGYFDRGPIPNNPPFTYGNLYRDFAFNQVERQMVFTMSGLSASTAYAVTWFSYDNGGAHRATFTGINGSSGTAGPLIYTGGVVPTANYDRDNSITALFTTNGAGTLTVQANDTGDLRVNGFEIAVPSSVVTTGPGNLRILSLTNTEVTLGWDGGGVLQQSATLSGWEDLPGITSGEAFPRVGPQHFYRVRSSSETDPEITDLPAGWASADIGTVRQPGVVSYDAVTKAFTIRTIGEVTESRGTFAYTAVRGDFVATCRVTAASQNSVGAGLMVRTSTNSEARFLKNAFNGFRFGNGPAMTARQTDGVAAWQPGDITHVQPVPCWVRIIRYRDSLASYYSADGKEWNLMHFGGTRFSPGLPEEVLVGVVNSQHDSNVLEEATIDSFSIEKPVKLPYVTSWLGNSFASQYYQGHVQMQIRAMCIQPGPKPLLRITGQNEALDSSVYDLDGNLLHMYQLEWSGGEAIACDSNFMFETTGAGPLGRCRLDRFPVALDRIGANGSDASQTRSALVGATITGVAVQGGKVYVGEAVTDRIVVLDAVTLAEIRAFPTPRPGALALGGDGNLWVVRRPGTAAGPIFDSSPPDSTPPAQVLCYGLDGIPKPERTITFPGVVDAVIPDKIAVNPLTGNLYVCDVGRNQCVWIFDAQGNPAGRFGALGGVYKNTIPGRVDAAHLYFPRAITFDATGCLYLAMVPRQGWVGGAVLRKYDPTGTSIVWERQGLEFQEAADGDPGTDGVDVFTQTHRYKMDFSKGPGQEAVYSALTFDPFTYPGDKRNSSNGGGVNATTVRRIGGKRILFLFEWARNGWMLYRFKDGSEIAIPCGKVTNDGLWLDRNGDGKSDPTELGPKPSFGHCWTVDANGDIWSTAGQQVRCWRHQGLNEHGAPIYTQVPTETYALPAPYTEASHVIYDAVLDRLFVGGFTAGRPRDSKDHGGSVGAFLSGFAEVRASRGLGQRLWQRDLPYIAGTAGGGNETNNFFCASYAGDAQGGYLFIGGLSERGVKKISIQALDPKTGAMVQRFLPGPEVAGYCGWFDFNNAINAMKRKDGEYILYAEDDGAQKVNMFRWRP